MKGARRPWPWVVLAILVVVPSSVYGLRAVTTPHSNAPSSLPLPVTPLPMTPPPSPVPIHTVDGFINPVTYWQACTYEAIGCDPAEFTDPAFPSPQSPLPAALQRPLRVPVLKNGQPCPISPASEIAPDAIGGTSLGPGPVRLLGSRTIDFYAMGPTLPGWYSPGSVDVTWSSDPSYQGPWIVRGTRVGGSGFVIFPGDPADTVAQIVPPIGLINDGGGYRWIVGPDMYVREPGCYAVQVDGLTFSYDIFFNAVLHG